MASKLGRWSVLVDLSGTLHIENTPTPGAVEALQKLRKLPVNIKFVTNTTKESANFLFNRLRKLGFIIDKSEIFTSLVAARDHVTGHKLRPLLLLDEKAHEDFAGIETANPNAVVIGLAPSEFNYHRLNEAFRLVHSGAALIGIHKARYYQTASGLSLGPGPFVTALEYATERKAVVVGKPERDFFLAALSGFPGASVEKAVMIGDDVRDDVGGAQTLGMKGILVKTGKYRIGDEGKISPPPSAVVKTFADAVLLVEEISK